MNPNDLITSGRLTYNHKEGAAKSCLFPNGITIKPDGIREMIPHEYEIAEIHEDAIVEVCHCKYCGEVDIRWYRTADTISRLMKSSDKDVEFGFDKCDGFSYPHPHVFVSSEAYAHATIQVMKCRKCGDLSVSWLAECDTEMITEEDIEYYRSN